MLKLSADYHYNPLLFLIFSSVLDTPSLPDLSEAKNSS